MDNIKPVHCGCGGEAKVIMLIPEVYAVECSKCYIRTGGPACTEAEAITAWNRAMSEQTAKVKMLLCGNCHESNIFDVVTRQHYKYCPSCGARLEWE